MQFITHETGDVFDNAVNSSNGKGKVGRRSVENASSLPLPERTTKIETLFHWNYPEGFWMQNLPFPKQHSGY